MTRGVKAGHRQAPTLTMSTGIPNRQTSASMTPGTPNTPHIVNYPSEELSNDIGPPRIDEDHLPRKITLETNLSTE